MKRIPVFLIMTFLLLIVVPGCGGSEPAGSIEERGPTHFCLVDPCIGYEVDLAVEPEAETGNVEAENQDNTRLTSEMRLTPRKSPRSRKITSITPTITWVSTSNFFMR